MSRKLLRLCIHGNLVATSLSVALLPLVVPITPALAQESRQDDMDGDIIVTARKREESVSSAAAGVNVFSTQSIRDLNIVTPQDAIALSPGGTTFAGNPLENGISIRGIASGDESASGSSGVLVTVDGEPLTRDFFKSVPQFDVARVEVLRGPQGTTQGRNAVGGVIATVTQRPTLDNSGYAIGEVTERGDVRIEGAVNALLNPQFAARLSSLYSHRGGFFKDVTTGDKVDTGDVYAVRGQILGELGGTEILLRAHYSKEEYDNISPKQYTVGPDQPLLFSFASPPLPPFPDVFDPAGIWRVDDIDDGNLFLTREVYGSSLEITSPLTSDIQLTSLTAYRRGKAADRINLFGTPIDVTVDDSRDAAKTFSQELRLDNTASQSPLTFVSGLFYLHERHRRLDRFSLFDQPTFPASFVYSTLTQADELSKVDSLGIFADFSYDFGQGTKLSFGGRYSYDKQTYHVLSTSEGLFSFIFLDSDDNGNPIPVDATGKESWDKITYRVGLQHQLDEDNMVYVNYATGYKAGGFNPKPFNTAALARFSYAPENVKSIEAGIRTAQWNGAFRGSLTWFSSKYTDIQRDTFDPNGAVENFIGNVGAAKIAGFEAELAVRPVANLRLDGSAAYYYDRHFTKASDPLVLGNPLANVPEWTVRLGAVYTVWLPDNARLRFRGDYSTRADVYDDDYADRIDPAAFRPAINNVNLRLTYEASGGRWEVSAFARNLLNEGEILAIGPSVPFTTGRPTTYGPGRQIGLSGTVQF